MEKFMFDTIRWKAFLRVTTKEKAEKLLRRLSKALDKEITILHSEPYWKDSSLFEASFTTPLAAKDVHEAVFGALLSAGQVSYGWSVRCPSEYAGNKWDFAGETDKKIRIAGVISLEFEIKNYH